MTLPDSIPVNPLIVRDQLSDGRARFREIVDAINTTSGERLPDHRSTFDMFYELGSEPQGQGAEVVLDTALYDVNVIVVPGYLTECVAPLVDCLTDAMAHLETLGARTSIAQVAGRGGCAHNGRVLRDHILNVAQDTDRRTILIPMSKGAPDTLEMLDQFPEMAEHIDAIVSLVGCVGGSPLKYAAPKWLKAYERSWWMPNCKPHGGEAVVSLDPQTRTAFLQRFEMPDGIKTYSIGAVSSKDHVCKGLMPSYKALCRFDPVNGHLNDSQMMFADQFLPRATFLGALNCDHIASAIPVGRSRHWFARLVALMALDKTAFPREILVEAVVRQVLEDLPIE